MAKKNQKLLRLSLFVVIAIFILSTLASVLLYRQDFETENSIKLNFSDKIYEFKLRNNQNSYYYEVQSNDKKEKFVSYFLPYEVINQNFDKEFLKKLNNENFYLAFDPEDNEIQNIEFIRFDLSQNQGNKIVISGILNQSDKYPFLPLVDCKNTTMPILILKSSNVSSTYLINENCYEINFVKFETLKIRDLLVYLSRKMIVN
ncbi:MAG: hypothetical protein QXM96_01945 [Candidatus Woesearchaeota archaeon]